MPGRKSHPLKDSTGEWRKADVVALLCERVAGGMGKEEALAAGLQEGGKQYGLPSLSSVTRWANDHQPFADSLARAREAKAHKLAEEALQIADAPPERNMKGQVDAGAEKHRHTRIATRQWLAAKWNRKDYGEKMDVDIKHHGTIDLTTVLREANSRIIQGEVLPADSPGPSALPADCSDLFD